MCSLRKASCFQDCSEGDEMANLWKIHSHPPVLNKII
jgi:hypothetical protein